MHERISDVPEDPSGIPQPHDVLAAEEFGIGARDERLPPDPSGLHQPHDVLAAEEFAMPAGEDASHSPGGAEPRSWLPLLVVGAALALLWLRRRL